MAEAELGYQRESSAPAVITLASNSSATQARTVSDSVAEVLCSLGVREGFGLVGGGNAVFTAALAKSTLRIVHCRHEGGAAFAATEASLAAGRPTLVFATTGPGILNALTGLAAARWEGAQVILVSGVTSAAQRGRWAAQETSSYSLPNDLFSSGSLFHYATVLESVNELPTVARRLQNGLSRSGGFVAHLALPIRSQRQPTTLPKLNLGSRRPSIGCEPRAIARVTDLLKDSDFVIWAGFGARHCASLVKRLAELSGARVMCTPRAKGVMAEDHPQYLGVTGMGGHESVPAALIAKPPRHVLVLGSRLGEGSSFWNPALLPQSGFIHVDLDPDVPGVAYAPAPTIGITAEIGAFLEALIQEWQRCGYTSTLRSIAPRVPWPQPSPRAGKIRASFLMNEIQRVIVEGSNALVMAECGNAFAWTTSRLSFKDPERYRVSPGFGSMGHFTAGVVGAALASGRKAIAIVGDGSMLMNNEVSTAVVYQAPAVWIVLNDGRYGMVEQGMRAQGLSPVETRIPATDFEAIARGMGANGRRVTSEAELGGALEFALRVEEPYVLDVVIDGDEPSPVLSRVKSLMEQGQSQPEGRS